LDAIATEERFEKGVKCGIISASQYNKNCVVKFDPNVAKLMICHSTGRSQQFPLQFVRSLEVEEAALRAVREADVMEEAQNFFGSMQSNLRDQSSAPQGFYRSVTLAEKQKSGPVNSVSGLSRGPSQAAMMRGSAGLVQGSSGGIVKGSSGGLVKGSSTAMGDRSGVAEGRILKLTSEVIDGLEDKQSYIAVGIQGCNAPLVLFFDNKKDRDDFVQLVQVLQVIFGFKIAETDQDLRLRKQQEQFDNEEEDEPDEDLDDVKELNDDIDAPKPKDKLPLERHVIGETGLKFRYFRRANNH